MKIHAARVELLPREQVEVLKPRDLHSRYEKVARVLGMALLFPGTIAMLVILFAMPSQLGVIPVIVACSFLHVVLLLGMLALVSALEKPLVTLLMRFGWPLHRWWMVNHSPEELQIKTHRNTVRAHSPVCVEFNHRTGVLRAGRLMMDLSQPFRADLEWSATPEPRLRLRLSNHYGTSVSICSPLPRQLYWRWKHRVEALPRLEAGGVEVEWNQFRRLLMNLKPFGDANGMIWPHLLNKVLSEASPSTIPLQKEVQEVQQTAPAFVEARL